MDIDILNRLLTRMEYFFDIQMNSHHVKIANLAYEEYAAILLEIIQMGGLEWLKNQILIHNNKSFVTKVLIFLTVIDLEWSKNTYKEKIEKNPVMGSLNNPTVWNNFVDPVYLNSTKSLLDNINKKRKINLKM